jgi:hypothetical protein
VARDGIGLSCANEICNLQILQGAESAKSATIPNGLPNLLQNLSRVREFGEGNGCVGSEGGSGLTPGTPLFVMHDYAISNAKELFLCNNSLPV